MFEPPAKTRDSTPIAVLLEPITSPIRGSLERTCGLVALVQIDLVTMAVPKQSVNDAIAATDKQGHESSSDVSMPERRHEAAV
jgi:hypothetical protein